MAFCSNCGAQLDGAKKFCTGCGTAQTESTAQPVQAAQPQQQAAAQPAPQPAYQPQSPAKKKSKAPVFIGIFAVVIVAAVVAAGVFTNGFGLLGGGNGNNSGDPTGSNSNPTSTNSGSENQDNKPFTPDKTKYAPGDTIRVTVKNVTQDMVDNGACIGIYKAGAGNDDYIDFAFVSNTGSSTVELNAPDEDGNYELRLFKSDNREASNIIHTTSITVGNATQPSGSDPTSTPGGNTSTPGGNNNGGTGYPKEWPSAVPKMDGKVIDGTVLDDGHGHVYGSVTLEVKNKNDVDSYVNSLKSKGYKIASENDGDPYYCELDNGEYGVAITFTSSNNQAIISLSKTQ